MHRANLVESIITSVKDSCRECGGCIRECPVSAIKITAGQVAIIEERCIHCGGCLSVCAPGAIVMNGDADRVRKMLAGDRVIAIIAPEIIGAFPESNPNRIESSLLSLGFFGVEENILGEELVAREYLDYIIKNDSKRPIIRSTCRAVVELIEKFYPELIPNLAPIVSPMVAQGRMIKALYPEDVKTVFIGPCVAKKMEAPHFADRPIDAVLTFGELKSLLGQVDPANGPEPSKSSYENERPLLARTLSVSEGFPRSILADRPIIDNSLEVGWGILQAKQLVASLGAYTVDRPKLLDLMGCRGCIDGPGMEADVPLSRRKSAVSEYLKKRETTGVSLEQLRSSLPDIDLTGHFISRKVFDLTPTAEQLESILKEGGMENAADELNCGSCGYATCRHKAIAIHRGLADWSMCFPRQKKIFIQSTDQLREISATDGLTGIMNHRAFLEKLKEEFHRVMRYKTQLSLVMIDVDRFKTINDTHGHLAGDRILKLVSELLQYNLRETDFAARYGGDEFALILPQTSKTEAFAVAEKLRLLVAETLFFINEDNGDQGEKVTLSLGVCVMNQDDTDPLAVIARADKAMYEAKKNGRNQTIISG